MLIDNTSNNSSNNNSNLTISNDYTRILVILQ